MIDQSSGSSYLPPNPSVESSMTAAPDLSRLAVGDRVQDPLLVLDVDQRESARGGFTTLTLGNSHGQLPSAPFWAEDQPRIAGIARGDVAQVIGEVGQYNGRRQLKVSSIRVLPRGAVDWRQLLRSVGDVAPYWDTLDRWREEIRRPRLRATLALLFDDADFRRRFEECPASTSGHHAALGGLLKHTCEVAAIGRAIAKVCRADAELVLAGALLHDIGKLEAYRWDGVFEHTERGTLLGHVALGLLMFGAARLPGARPAVHRPGAGHPPPLHRLAPREARVRRHGAPDDARGGGPPLRRQRERQDSQHGGRAGRCRELRRRCPGQRPRHLAARPAEGISWQQRLGGGSRGVEKMERPPSRG